MLLLQLLLLLAGEQQDCEFRICNPNARAQAYRAPVAKATEGQRAARGACSSKSESQLLKPKNKQLKRLGGGTGGG